jgi:hypothetical protein
LLTIVSLPQPHPLHVVEQATIDPLPLLRVLAHDVAVRYRDVEHQDVFLAGVQAHEPADRLLDFVARLAAPEPKARTRGRHVDADPDAARADEDRELPRVEPIDEVEDVALVVVRGHLLGEFLRVRTPMGEPRGVPEEGQEAGELVEFVHEDQDGPPLLHHPVREVADEGVRLGTAQEGLLRSTEGIGQPALPGEVDLEDTEHGAGEEPHLHPLGEVDRLHDLPDDPAEEEFQAVIPRHRARQEGAVRRLRQEVEADLAHRVGGERVRLVPDHDRAPAEGLPRRGLWLDAEERLRRADQDVLLEVVSAVSVHAHPALP